jgi:hypothetical protein
MTAWVASSTNIAWWHRLSAPTTQDRLPCDPASPRYQPCTHDCADLLGLATFMAAAGISCSQRLGDLVAGLEPASEAAAVALLGPARRP